MQTRIPRYVLVIIGLAAALAWGRFTSGFRSAEEMPAGSAGVAMQQPEAPPALPAPAQAARGGPVASSGSPGADQQVRGFRSHSQLKEHFSKHGAEFRARSAADYLALAVAVRDAPVGEDVIEAVRDADGVISRYQRSTGAFLAFDADGTIRTFFKPTDGERYFHRQLARHPQ